ncbi:hypothetical protein MA04_04147 [Alcanivorax balearicus MACL04]|uniref:Uncharacterized protein n=1 Tax=Alloalcanivorax balearicus MACL04 TaxID=1177182 RepID=A0ABT2R4Y3_9GAMM|nr:hypothetical protein [Alloalcanivorax balearicus]MCU5784847.1 hypothetical protein [Alloalcanivorax balearicus MACL04]
MKCTIISAVFIAGLIHAVSNTAWADSGLEYRIAKYKPICSDYERAKRYAECHKPPGSYKHAYEMTGKARESALAQGRKLINMRKGTDRALENRGKRRRVYR